MKTYVIHVSTAIDREKHMIDQLNKKGLEGIFINQGDIKDLTLEVLDKYFSGVMKSAIGSTSCPYKHILAYEQIQQSGEEYALILEDDIFLEQNFLPGLKKIIFEIKERKLNNLIVSLEDSSLNYVKGSELKNNYSLYKKNYGRMAAAYLVDRIAVQNMIKEIETNKCGWPIDWFHNYCSDKNIINIFWVHPTIAIQGSLNGQIKSLIDNSPSNYFRIISFKLQRVYKRILWKLR
ncbi:MAG: glycosyltransferase family 25 protein [Saprospiraceae bacterium]